MYAVVGDVRVVMWAVFDTFLSPRVPHIFFVVFKMNACWVVGLTTLSFLVKLVS